jgi:hypothetical protein
MWIVGMPALASAAIASLRERHRIPTPIGRSSLNGLHRIPGPMESFTQQEALITHDSIVRGIMRTDARIKTFA